MGKYVLYWMQQAQRVRYNPALNYSIRLANSKNLPLVVCFIITAFPEGQNDHYRFMIEGLKEIESGLKEKNIRFLLKTGKDIVDEVIRLSEEAEFLIMDRGYLRIQREWRKSVQKEIKCAARIIDTDSIIPVIEASDKAEIAARTLRPKIKKLLDKYLSPVPDLSLEIEQNSQIPENILRQHKKIYRLYGEREDNNLSIFRGGNSQAKARLDRFIKEKLALYSAYSNDPSLNIVSTLSPYLHFGQISVLEIALEVIGSHASQEAKDAYLEQLIVRRELALNFIWHNPDYDKYESAVPEWAQRSLELHLNDPREFSYSLEEYEQAKTHDIYWNAAQNQLLKTGFMHNYMRMYWGKKIIEWTDSPQQAYKWMCWLNNKYQLDGRDANSYTGIAWCFGLHDHPWKERAIFGKVRYMNAKGLERKFDIIKYAETWNQTETFG